VGGLWFEPGSRAARDHAAAAERPMAAPAADR